MQRAWFDRVFFLPHLCWSYDSKILPMLLNIVFQHPLSTICRKWSSNSTIVRRRRIARNRRRQAYRARSAQESADTTIRNCRDSRFLIGDRVASHDQPSSPSLKFAARRTELILLITSTRPSATKHERRSGFLVAIILRSIFEKSFPPPHLLLNFFDPPIFLRGSVTDDTVASAG